MFKVLSHWVDELTPTYNNGFPPIISCKDSLPRNLTIKLNNHTSTHIDLPAHFCKNGKKLENFNENFWFFDKVGFLESNVDDFLNKLSLISKEIEILFLKTGFEKYRETKKYILEQPSFPEETAYRLKEEFPNLKIFGFDMLSISSLKNRSLGRKHHIEFLCKNEILLLEDMRLSVLSMVPKFVIIAPLLIKKADAAPVFVYAKVEEK